MSPASIIQGFSFCLDHPKIDMYGGHHTAVSYQGQFYPYVKVIEDFPKIIELLNSLFFLDTPYISIKF